MQSLKRTILEDYISQSQKLLQNYNNQEYVVVEQEQACRYVQ